MDTKNAKKIVKQYGFTMEYYRDEEPGWSIDNPKNGCGSFLTREFFKNLTEEEFIKHMDELKNGKFSH